MGERHVQKVKTGEARPTLDAQFWSRVGWLDFDDFHVFYLSETGRQSVNNKWKQEDQKTVKKKFGSTRIRTWDLPRLVNSRWYLCRGPPPRGKHCSGLWSSRSDESGFAMGSMPVQWCRLSSVVYGSHALVLGRDKADVPRTSKCEDTIVLLTSRWCFNH